MTMICFLSDTKLGTVNDQIIKRLLCSKHPIYAVKVVLDAPL